MSLNLGIDCESSTSPQLHVQDGCGDRGDGTKPPSTDSIKSEPDCSVTSTATGELTICIECIQAEYQAAFILGQPQPTLCGLLHLYTTFRQSHFSTTLNCLNYKPQNTKPNLDLSVENAPLHLWGNTW